MMTRQDSLLDLATRVGLLRDWTDAAGRSQQVSDATLQTLLARLGYPAATRAQRHESASRMEIQQQLPAALLTADAGQWLGLPRALTRQSLALRAEDGGRVRLEQNGTRLRAPAQPGYYRLEHSHGSITLAVAPPRCFGVADSLASERVGASHDGAWGLSVQVYSLARPGDGGAGDSHAVRDLARRIAATGGAAIGLSPLHAVGPVTRRYSPYSPSDRAFLNPLLADPAQVLGNDVVDAALVAAGIDGAWQQHEGDSLIDWPAVASLREQLWRVLFSQLPHLPQPLVEDFRHFVDAGAAALDAHALVTARQWQAAGRDESTSWRDWSGDWTASGSRSAQRFSAEHPEALERERFKQWITARAWQDVQQQSREGGMHVGLIADLAVGFDPGGAEAWAHRPHLLQGLGLGAPPDALAPQGQQWGIASFSPLGLKHSGFAPFLQTLRASMRVGGGIRLDHILGLSRLWIVPDGAMASEGGYLRYPLDDLLRLVALESWRHRCIVIGEDLGTVPDTLRATLAQRNVMGTDVLLFCREEDGAFTPSTAWRHGAMATTTTHDLPPLMGWRKGLDLIARAQLESPPQEPSESSMQERRADAQELDRRLDAMPSRPAPPAPPDWQSIRFVARSAASLVLIPMEDVLGRVEQPNLPGTVDEHPNWRQRLPDVNTQPQFQPMLDWIATGRGECNDDAGEASVDHSTATSTQGPQP